MSDANKLVVLTAAAKALNLSRSVFCKLILRGVEEKPDGIYLNFCGEQKFLGDSWPLALANAVLCDWDGKPKETARKYCRQPDIQESKSHPDDAGEALVMDSLLPGPSKPIPMETVDLFDIWMHPKDGMAKINSKGPIKLRGLFFIDIYKTLFKASFDIQSGGFTIAFIKIIEERKIHTQIKKVEIVTNSSTGELLNFKVYQDGEVLVRLVGGETIELESSRLE